jgi:hypothetical protein
VLKILCITAQNLIFLDFYTPDHISTSSVQLISMLNALPYHEASNVLAIASHVAAIIPEKTKRPDVLYLTHMNTNTQCVFPLQ